MRFFFVFFIAWIGFIDFCKGKCEILKFDDLEYDLNPLNSTHDYIAINTRYPSYSFRINVCRPIVHLDEVCVANTGICEVSSFSSSKIGEYATTFRKVGDVLEMIYPRGAGCFNGKINFECDPSAGIGKPVYLTESCEYAFEWKTAYACPKSFTETPCNFNVNGRTYDLRDLSSTYLFSDTEGREYTLSPCKPFSDQDPPYYENGYSFQRHNSTLFFNLGSKFYNVTAFSFFDDQLNYSEQMNKSDEINKPSEIIQVSYTGGDECLNLKQRSFKINYSCGPNRGFPYFVREESCTYYLDWKTNLVC